MTTAERLKKAGFVHISTRKVGMYKKVYWQDPVSHEVVPQYLALLYLQERTKAAKINSQRV